MWGEPINIYKFNAIHLQNITKNGILWRLQHNIQKSYSDIDTKIISELNSFYLQNNVMLKNYEDACDEAYSVNF